ncbi:MAG: S9 family peptidase [Gemmatimonadota bacterium]|nr:MAG: S9 family peptidase [Gemmatimonadota bacterium]
MPRHSPAISAALSALVAGTLGLPACNVQQDSVPPMAKQNSERLEHHGDIRIDDYYWLNQRDNPEVIEYLEAENEYTEAMTAHIKDLEDELFEEMRGRIKEDDSSVPYRLDDYFYYTRFEEGQEYPIYVRRRESMEAPEEIMLDANALAEGHGFFSVGRVMVSSGQDILAFTQDTVGRRIYEIRFKNLTTGDMLPEVISNVTSNIAWAEDNQTLFYTRQDPETLRWFQIFRHKLGTDPSQDMLVYEEQDEEFSSFVFKTKSKRFVMIGSQQTLSSEFRYLEATDPTGEFTVFLQRERDHEHSVDHFEDKFYIRTNYEAENFRLMETPVGDTRKRAWSEVIPHREDVFLSSFEIFAGHLVLAERREGLMRLRIMPWDNSAEHYLDFGEPAYWAGIGTNPNFDTPVLRYNYTSMTTPRSVFDYDMNTRESTLLKRDEVLGGFGPENYETERLWASAPDGTRVPISLVYRKGIEKDGSNPLLLYGYGSYGASMDATFSSARLSLLDRGFVYAIAHVRGGQEMGRWWYEDGKLLQKKNTFTDFIACAEHLVDQQYTNESVLFAMGASAGGLLIGAVTNMRPDLFKGVVAGVPFVDVVTTMLDESIPLTTSEYDEWGNPNEKEYYDYMLSYSPYDNIEAKDYPNLLVTTGLHDSQVQYWEPAKWVAKLRALKTDDNVILLKTNMEAGHGGASGRFRRLRETALQYAFMIDLAGRGN